jgi:hypothetical protein
MKAILVMSVVLLALTGITAAHAAVPAPGVVCGYCDGSGYNGCATVGDVAEDGNNDTAGAWYHWCWNNGSIYDNYGYCTYGTQAGMTFQGWGSDHEISYGHDCVGHFGYFFWPWLTNTVHRCIAVDGWGNAWICRAWYE